MEARTLGGMFFIICKSVIIICKKSYVFHHVQHMINSLRLGKVQVVTKECRLSYPQPQLAVVY